MADRFWGRIETGGRLPPEHLHRFCRAAGIGTAEICEHIEDDHFVLDSQQQAYGQFPDLESLCVELGMPYVRQSDGMYEYTPQLVFFTPGMKEPRTVTLDHDGEMHVPMGVLFSIRDAIREQRYDEISDILETHIAERPELPPFTAG